MSAHRKHLRATWPLHRRQTVQLLVGWAALTALWIGFGMLIESRFGRPLVRTDERVAEWLVAQRTPTLDDLSLWGSLLAETSTKIVVTALLALLFLVVWRRWFEAALVALSLIIEAAAFITVTAVVGRGRPDVLRLDESPVNSSFPSGHVAAAAAYAAIAVVMFWHTRKRWARVLIVLTSALVVIIVALARMYRGMHFLSDTVAGALLGCAAVALTTVVLARSPEAASVVDPSSDVDPASEVLAPPSELSRATEDDLQPSPSDRLVV